MKESIPTKLFIVVNVDWFFLSHRLPIALEALNRGYDVTILAMEEESRADEIRGYGLKFIPLPSTRGSINVFNELTLLLFLRNIYRKHRPDIIHHVTIKPALYGTIAARIVGHKNIVNAISGLGSNLISKNRFDLKQKIFKIFYRFALSGNALKVIVQNNDDKEFIMANTGVSSDRIFIIFGSGIDLNKFAYTPENEQQTIVLLAARMLKDKGIVEYKEAATDLKRKYPNVKFILAGKVDQHNVTGIEESELQEWSKNGILEWVGHVADIKKAMIESNIVVLPSYREGLPKTLVEACAIGRAIVTTDVPGCRDVVINEENGFLVPAKNSGQLVTKIEKLILDINLRKRMGRRGREIAEQKFALESIVNAHFKIYLD